MAFKDWFSWLPFAKKSAQRSDPYAATYGNGSSGGFAGAGVGRLTASLATWAGSVNADLDGGIVILRARARQLSANNEYGRRFLSMVGANVVGHCGPTLQVRATTQPLDKNARPVLDKVANDAIESAWSVWQDKADITGRVPLSHLMRTVAKAVARDGEALVRIVRGRSLAHGIALQVLEADRLDETLNLSDFRGNTVRQGVEMDTTGRPVAYWIKQRHPGENYGIGRQNIERVSAADILHVFLPERGEQVRGYTWFHAVLLRTAQLHQFNEAAVLAARIGASKIAALEQSEDALPSDQAFAPQADGISNGALQLNVEGGEMFQLPPGYKLNSWDPEYPHANYESFVKATMRGISSGLDVATHNLSGDMTDVNYSSARIAELSEREQWMTLQDWFIFQTYRRIYEEWLGSALLRGEVTFPATGKALPADRLQKFLDASRFQGRRWRWVDPQKEIEAARAAVELNVTSRTKIAAEQGDDLDDIIDELAQETADLKAQGLPTSATNTAKPGNDPAVIASKHLASALNRIAETLNKD